ncbi:MAG: hypothetical protein V4819_06035 [Verrucomicrobiota bacterium]
MKNPCHWLTAALLSTFCDAAQIARESFDYASASSLTTQGGGSGWLGAWFQDGESAVTGAAGLGFTDSQGNILDAPGRAADTTGSATTRSLRDFGGGLLNNVWISFLYQLPASNSKFEGVSFYRGTQSVFSISNPSATATAAIHLANNLVSSNGVSTGRGVFGQTHLIVLKLTKFGGTGGVDRIEAFIDPILTSNPPSPTATVDGANFDFNRVRIAGQDGSPLLVDELRVGEDFADVTPHTAVVDDDSDDDGLTDSQEAVLGLDPNQSDAVLIAGILAHPDWFGLYTSSGILGLGHGGVVLQRNSTDPANLIFEVQHSENLTHWGMLETFNRQVALPTGKNFLRVTLQDP